MSLIPGEPLDYAETHFKFKLPWSILYRPWPEILIDAPFQFVPGAEPTLWIVVRDAHRFPVAIEKLEVSIRATGELQAITENACSIELNIEAREQFGFYPIPLSKLGICALKPSHYELTAKVTAKRLASHEGDKALGKRKTFTRWNYPLLKPAPIKFQILGEALPKPQGYIAGEMHCHTHYSADHVEHGASPATLQAAANAVGLDFVSLTDHAYDFAYLTEDYTKEAPSPLPRFEALKREAAECNLKGGPLMIAGEEVSAGNSKGENVHMTVLGSDCYLPGLGDCGRNWLNNRPTFKIEKLTAMTHSHCFAAHPMQEMGALERFVFRRGFWSHKDLSGKRTIRGIQFWNGLRDEGFKQGRAWWVEELGKENYLLPIGGNDAHGDMNETTAVELPLISLKHNHDHVFGKVRTVVKLAGEPSAPLTLADVNAAFDGSNCYITDGPALWWEAVNAANASDSKVIFHARSTGDVGGPFRYIRILGRRRLLNGKLAAHEELHISSQVAARPSTDIELYFEDYAYLRAECETATGKFALTSAAVNPQKQA